MIMDIEIERRERKRPQFVISASDWRLRGKPSKSKSG
jgi:hypothetical protein